MRLPRRGLHVLVGLLWAFWGLTIIAGEAWTAFLPLRELNAVPPEQGPGYGIPETQESKLEENFYSADARAVPLLADVDGDGRADLVTLTMDKIVAHGKVDVALSKGSCFGLALRWHDYFAGHRHETILLGDFDGDGRGDLASWSGATTREVSVLLSNGRRFEGPRVWLDRPTFRAMRGPRQGDRSDIALSGDVNADGKDDIVFYSRNTAKISVAFSNGTSFGPLPGETVPGR